MMEGSTGWGFYGVCLGETSLVTCLRSVGLHFPVTLWFGVGVPTTRRTPTTQFVVYPLTSLGMMGTTGRLLRWSDLQSITPKKVTVWMILSTMYSGRPPFPFRKSVC